MFDGFDVEKLCGKWVVIVDDVVLSGGILYFIIEILDEVGV